MPIMPSPKYANWIVVADESLAVIYLQEKKRSALKRLHEMPNEDARKKTEDLLADKGGRSFDSHGQGRHTMEREKSDPKTQVSARFAKTIASLIEQKIQNGECDGFALIAAPRFLGQLRDAIATSGAGEPFLTIDKDVVRQDATTIESLLAETL